MSKIDRITALVSAMLVGKPLGATKVADVVAVAMELDRATIAAMYPTPTTTTTQKQESENVSK